MFQISPAQTAQLKHWFIPDQPGPLIGLHVIHTGHGACFVDRWPNPRAVLTDTAGNYALAGDPAGFGPDDLQSRLSGFVAAPEEFLPLLKATFPDLIVWDRIILDLQTEPNLFSPTAGEIRRLETRDAFHLWGLSPMSAWIYKTWGSPEGLASSGLAWGAFIDGRLVSVACTFFVGQRYEEIGVATEPEFRGRGLSVACTGALCDDIRERGRWSSWTTSPDNVASLRVAEKLGFQLHHRDYLYVVGRSVPA